MELKRSRKERKKRKKKDVKKDSKKREIYPGAEPAVDAGGTYKSTR